MQRVWDIRVTEIMRWHWLVLGLALLFLVVLAWAWLDAGREPLRPIVEVVPVPEMPR